MTHYIKTYYNTVDAAMENYKKQIEPDNIEKTAWSRLVKVADPITIPSQESLDSEKEKVLQELRTQVDAEIAKAKTYLKQAIAEEQQQIDRLTLAAETGRTLVADYAKTHKISFDAAKAELDDYANTNPRVLTDSLRDKYAGIRNRHHLEGEAQSRAHNHLIDEMNRSKIPERRQAIKEADYPLNTDIMQAWDTSGYQLVRQMRNQAPEGNGNDQ